ncbi:restriction endonuclease subunit M, partial [Klebsiella quasipneumoniae]|nr:restriction endonuclease subunit M [Klebsiella pneumoniae]HAJ2627718.1 restriction endonuclease subunit M [Escherichia coli]HBY0687392.1 restriction endonuclease subunit M [Klebsiella pneumoniae]HBY0693314.1 restriction endonuclease subunit M [Klebsiella pneumoniae]HBY0699333.1 restriction endonuclease subunit M [Klebsiella pneumoniae]
MNVSSEQTGALMSPETQQLTSKALSLIEQSRY